MELDPTSNEYQTVASDFAQPTLTVVKVVNIYVYNNNNKNSNEFRVGLGVWGRHRGPNYSIIIYFSISSINFLRI